MPKRLVLCFDGTWNNADSARAETNVARIARAVRAGSSADGVQQITLYLRGVGSTGLAVQRLVDGATGAGVDDNIRSGYMFLAQNYVPGDAIYPGKFMRPAGPRERRAADALAETRSRLIPTLSAGVLLVRIAGLAGCGVRGWIGASAPLLSR